MCIKLQQTNIVMHIKLSQRYSQSVRVYKYNVQQPRGCGWWRGRRNFNKLLLLLLFLVG